MHQRIRRILPVIIVLVLAALAIVWYVWGRGTGSPTKLLSASGTVEAVEVVVAPELSGRVAEVLAAKSDAVTSGQPLLKLDDTLLQAQRNQAKAAYDTAQAATDSARAALETTRRQYQQVLETAQVAESASRNRTWTQSQPWEFDQPDWYFGKSEQIAAMQQELDAARIAFLAESDNLNSLLNRPEFANLPAAEQDLARARAAFLVAQDSLDRANNALSNEDLQQAAQDRLDAAKQELEDAQTAYDDLLDNTQTADVLKARAAVRAAEDRCNTALDRLARLHTGEFAPAVQVAASVVTQAEKAVAQADLLLAQSQTQLDLLDAQIAKLTVYAPADGVVLERNIEPGEMALAGSSALVVGKLDHLTITVFLPEDRYGEVNLGQKVSIAVDSFPGKSFSGSVSRIAQRAEFTPRNVQTEEGRRTTVFAVEISIDSPDGSLKPGMPADVTFEE